MDASVLLCALVVGASGYILMCAHCVSRYKPTTVVYRAEGETEEQTAAAEIVSRDLAQDLALLRISPKGRLPPTVFAPPIEVEHGEEVTVISNPTLGESILKNTITTGVVSNAGQAIEGEVYIQSSAAVNPGSSGGPMFDQSGRVIGMVVLKARIEGVGFAVPAVRLTKFLLGAANREGADGRLARAWVDAKSTKEQLGRLVKAEAGKITILEGTDDRPRELDVAELSAGDRAFVKLLATDAAK